MTTLIITVAGSATRFNKDLDREVLKCIYYEESPKYALLYQLLDKARDLDEYIIVGGYLFNQLETFCNQELQEFRHKIKLIYNEHFLDYGSGYSLLKATDSLSPNTKNVIFVEGDLFYTEEDFTKIIESKKNVVSINKEPIYANKAVVLYLDTQQHIHYLYDTAHQILNIREPFCAVFNSAQMWKFNDTSYLQRVRKRLTDEQEKGTNLELIDAYFRDIEKDSIDIIPIETWYNCNTVKDYHHVYKFIKVHENN